MEIWKTAIGFDRYEISSLGNVRNVNTKKIMRAYVGNKGYVKVTLRKGLNRRSTVRLHRLVAEAFLPNPLAYKDVDHINRVRHDNAIDNLRWVSRAENSRNKINKVGLVEHIIHLHNSGKSVEDIYESIQSL